MKKVLVVIPFESIYPTMNGGMLRAFNLLIQLTKHFETTAIINQDEQSFLKALEEFPTLKKCRVISTRSSRPVRDLFSILPGKYRDALRYRYWNRSIKGPAESDFLKIYSPLNKLLKETEFDYVILEDMSILNLAKLIRWHQPGVRIIYDAYNVNQRLAEVSLAKGEISQATYDMIKVSESSLFRKVNRIFTCSDNDLMQLIEMNGGQLKGAVIPNGVNVPGDNRISMGISADNNDDILFCGSLDYLPNREGLAWFCQEIFPLVIKKKPTARLMIVGKGEPGNTLRQLFQSTNIIYYGKVESVSDYYKKAAVALVPLLSGSGTRLKLLEAMGYGVPVVSTTIGAEGIAYSDKEDILIADDSLSFANAVIHLLEDKAAAGEMAAKALSFVKESYEWNVVGEKLRAYLSNYQ